MSLRQALQTTSQRAAAHMKTGRKLECPVFLERDVFDFRHGSSRQRTGTDDDASGFMRTSGPGPGCDAVFPDEMFERTTDRHRSQPPPRWIPDRSRCPMPIKLWSDADTSGDGRSRRHMHKGPRIVSWSTMTPVLTIEPSPITRAFR